MKMKLSVELINEVHNILTYKVVYEDPDTQTYVATLKMVGSTANWDMELPEPVMDFVEGYVRGEF